MMNLPPLENFTGHWPTYIEHIYDIFQETILNSGVRFCNLAVKPRYTPETQGKEYGFWHVVSEGDIEDEREPDLARCERIRWIEWMIESFSAFTEVSWWREKRGTTTEIVIWLEQEQYVVILSERRDYWLLKTAYLATRSGKIRQLTRNRMKYSQPR